MGWDMQWLFSASVTLYVLDYPYCGCWWNVILCNSWVIILLKIYKPAFLLIKHLCSIRTWVPTSVCLSLSLSPWLIFFPFFFFFFCLSLLRWFSWNTETRLAHSPARASKTLSRRCPVPSPALRGRPVPSWETQVLCRGLYWFSA